MSTNKVCNTVVLNIQWRFTFVVRSHVSQFFVYFPNQRNQSLFYLNKYRRMRKQSANSCLRFPAVPASYKLPIENRSLFFTHLVTDIRQIGIQLVQYQQFRIGWPPRVSYLMFLSFSAIPWGKAISSTENFDDKTLRRLYTDSYSNICRISSFINNADGGEILSNTTNQYYSTQITIDNVLEYGLLSIFYNH